jgi:hypothetical protein
MVALFGYSGNFMAFKKEGVIQKNIVAFFN